MTIVVAAVIEQNSRILVCQRRRDKPFPLKWEFPGGKVEPGESLEAALERELAEELDAHADIGREIYRVRYQYPGRPEPFELVFFSAKIGQIQFGAKATALRAFEQVIWVNPTELLKYDFLEANAELITQLANGSLLPGNAH